MTNWSSRGGRRAIFPDARAGRLLGVYPAL